MDILRPLDIVGSLSEARDIGASLTHLVLDERFLIVLTAEIIQGPFEKVDERGKLVEQKFERFAFLHQVGGLPNLELLRLSTQKLIRGAGWAFPILTDWQAKDIVVQKYEANDYLTAHKDLKRHPGVIAVYTITGTSRFELLGEKRDGSPIRVYNPCPGDLVLLRGTGLTNSLQDDRPFHRVGGSIGQGSRISVALRDNTDPDKPIPGFSYRNSREGG